MSQTPDLKTFLIHRKLITGKSIKSSTQYSLSYDPVFFVFFNFPFPYTGWVFSCLANSPASSSHGLNSCSWPAAFSCYPWDWHLFAPSRGTLGGGLERNEKGACHRTRALYWLPCLVLATVRSRRVVFSSVSRAVQKRKEEVSSGKPGSIYSARAGQKGECSKCLQNALLCSTYPPLWAA